MKTVKTAWELPEWLRHNFTIFGAEEPGDGGGDGAGDGDGDGEDGDGEDGEDGTDDDLSDSDKQDVNKLLTALAEERRARKALEKKEKQRERENTRKTKAEEDALAQAKREAEESSTKVKKLAEGYYKSAVDRAIEKAAADAKFKDVSDAVALVDRSLIDADQDEDDPAEVDIDKDSVKRAVKKLADVKKHLLQSGTEDGGPTGSSFGNSGKGGKNKPTDEERLKQAYPSLR